MFASSWKSVVFARWTCGTTGGVGLTGAIVFKELSLMAKVNVMTNVKSFEKKYALVNNRGNNVIVP